jgi:hypothetical protein
MGTSGGSCKHSNEPSGSINVGKFLSRCETGGFSRSAQLHGVSSIKYNHLLLLLLLLLFRI